MLTLGHRRWRRRVDLVACGAASDEERAAVAAHLEGCPPCAEALVRARSALALLAGDPVHGAEPPLGALELARRVEARLGRTAVPAVPPRAARSLWPAWTAAAAVVIAALAVAPPHGTTPSLPPSPSGAEALLRQMERQVSREHAARYLAEAQDVLVTVAAPPERCRRSGQRVDVAEEARRSRELLERRALLLDEPRPEVASAQPVLDEVEHMLREVAALESCVRRGQLEELEREITRRRLLMRMDLAARELLG
jgi:hypothetical protein